MRGCGEAWSSRSIGRGSDMVGCRDATPKQSTDPDRKAAMTMRTRIGDEGSEVLTSSHD